MTTVLRGQDKPRIFVERNVGEVVGPPHPLHNAHGKKFCRSAVGAQRSRAGALAGAALRILGRSATRSGAPEIEPERAWSGAPDFAGALIL